MQLFLTILLGVALGQLLTSFMIGLINWGLNKYYTKRINHALDELKESYMDFMSRFKDSEDESNTDDKNNLH